MTASPVRPSAIYKVCRRSEWEAASRAGAYPGSEHDLRDGFIHLSTAGQLPGTLAKHFPGQSDLLVVAVAPDRLEPLRWEPARGGELFPHLYGPLPPSAVLWVLDLPLGPGGHHLLPARIGV